MAFLAEVSVLLIVPHKLIHLFAVRRKQIEQDISHLAAKDLACRVTGLIARFSYDPLYPSETGIKVLSYFRRKRL